MDRMPFTCVNGPRNRSWRWSHHHPLYLYRNGWNDFSLGATPVFVDIQENDFNINPHLIEEKITPRTKAIVPVSLYETVTWTLNAIALKHNLTVIEDAAQSFGATYKGKRSGNLSTIATTSFSSQTFGLLCDGGVVFTNNAEPNQNPQPSQPRSKTALWTQPHWAQLKVGHPTSGYT